MRRLLLGIFVLFLLVAAGLFAAAATARRSGRLALQALLDRHAAEGYGASFADLAARAPPVDRERQGRLREWMKAPGPKTTRSHVPQSLTWRLEGRETPPDEVLEVHDAFREDAVALQALFAEGKLCLSSLGWLPEDPNRATFADRVGGLLPSLLRVRAAQNWFAAETMLAEDPTNAVASMDDLHDALASPGCLIDSMIAVACDALRDDAYVALALSKRLPPDRIEAWLDEEPRGASLTADGLRGERLRFGAPLALDLAAGGSIPEHMGAEFGVEGAGDIWEYHLRGWALGASECATYLTGMLALEQHVRGELDWEEAELRLAACEDLGPPFSLMVPNQGGMLVTATSSADRHGFVRIAASLALESRVRGGVPASEAEAWAWLRATRPRPPTQVSEGKIEYARLAEARFRLLLHTDISADRPRKMDAPAALEPLVLRHDLIEIDVRAPSPAGG